VILLNGTFKEESHDHSADFEDDRLPTRAARGVSRAELIRQQSLMPNNTGDIPCRPPPASSRPF
jgi:hypothetical protein